MRTPRRSFVVEYKASRRPTKAQPTSIWGKLDLRAVAREVETELQSAAPSKVSDNESNPEVAASKTPVDIDQDPNAEPVEPKVEVDVPQSIDDSGTIGAVPDADTPNAGEREPKAIRKRARRKAILPEPTQFPVAPVQTGALDELRALEAENRVLKRLMISRLRAENGQLKDKLRRFAADI